MPGGRMVPKYVLQVHRFATFILVKNCKAGKNSTTSKARENISTDLESLEF
jgi:hypothetical protein